jgi:predicted acyltransferase
MPTAAMVLIGTVFGDLLRQGFYTLARRVLLAGIVGAALLVAGHFAGLFLPMSKPLWTASYILFTAGSGGLVLAVLHALVDGTRSGGRLAFPLLVPGSNAITGYVLPILVKINILQGWSVATASGRTTIEAALQNALYDAAGRTSGGWLYTAGYIAVWWLVLYYLQRKQWFLRV